MIKINLVPSVLTLKGDEMMGSEASGGSEEIKRKGLVNLLVMLVLPVALYVYGMQVRPQRVAQLNNIQSQVAELRQYNEKYKDITAEIDQIKNDERSVQDRIDALKVVSLGRLAEIKLLDLVQSIIRERMWLKKLQVDEGKMVLEGLSQSEIDVNSLLEDLTKNVLFASPPRLAESNQETFEGLNFSRFKIEAKLDKSK